MDEVWQDEWPREEGLWWFYGWRFKKSPFSKAEEPPRLHVVSVGLSGNNVFMYTCEGAYLNKRLGSTGKWAKLIMPNLPDVPAR